MQLICKVRSNGFGYPTAARRRPQSDSEQQLLDALERLLNAGSVFTVH
jgi:hypothetical protein